jgi:hypothetical protein
MKFNSVSKLINIFCYYKALYNGLILSGPRNSDILSETHKRRGWGSRAAACRAAAEGSGLRRT